jgi:hypothetical protein
VGTPPSGGRVPADPQYADLIDGRAANGQLIADKAIDLHFLEDRRSDLMDPGTWVLGSMAGPISPRPHFTSNTHRKIHFGGLLSFHCRQIEHF